MNTTNQAADLNRRFAIADHLSFEEVAEHHRAQGIVFYQQNLFQFECNCSNCVWGESMGYVYVPCVSNLVLDK